MFAYMKFDTECKRHKKKDIVEVSRIKHYDKDWRQRSKYYKVECGTGKCEGLIIFVEDSIDKLKNQISTKRAVLPSKKKINPADDTTDSDYNVSARKIDKSEEVKRSLMKQIKKVECAGEKENQLISKRGISHKHNNTDEIIRQDKKAKVATSQKCEEILAERKIECNVPLHANLKDENKLLKLQIREKDEKVAILSRTLDETNCLNIQLQKSVISYFEEFKVNAKQFDDMKSREGMDTLPVGYIREADDTIHLGRDVWLSRISFNNAVQKQRSYQVVVKNLAVAVFGIKMLKASSITGMASNKFKDRKPKAKLNETKILAIQDIFRYWLSNIKKVSQVIVDVESRNVCSYIGKKISDLNRHSSRGKKSNKKEVIDDDANQHEENVDIEEVIDGDANQHEENVDIEELSISHDADSAASNDEINNKENKFDEVSSTEDVFEAKSDVCINNASDDDVSSPSEY